MSGDATSRHLTGLDSLRAIAFSFVLMTHFVQGTWPWTPWINGHIGVHLFFVISGFLITGILLDARTDADRMGARRGGIVGSFFARRVLRIFPLFYATLLVTYLAGFPGVRESIAWHLAYASNIFFFRRGDWLGQVSHFWSLAVEEQFYLVWPFVILFTPRKYITRLMLLFMLGASLFRYAGQLLWGWNDVQTEVLTFACLDSLASGALLAWWHRSDEVGARRIAGILTMTALPLWIVTTGVAANAVPSVAFVSRPLTAPALAAIVYSVALGRLGRFGSVLHWRPLVYLGRISYGMYMFHLFVPLTVRRVLRELFPATAMNRGVLIAIYTAVTVIAASLSWHFFESKINALKRFFPYLPTGSPAGAAALQPEPGSRAD